LYITERLIKEIFFLLRAIDVKLKSNVFCLNTMDIYWFAE